MIKEGGELPIITYLKNKIRGLSYSKKLILSYIFLIVVPVFISLFLYNLQLYKQTKSYYEDILVQLNERLNMNLNNYFTNQVRATFFYITDQRLYNIMDKSKPSNDKEYISDFNYMKNALEQVVLMNGNIDSIIVQAPNGSIYSSKILKDENIVATIERIGKDKIKEKSYLIYIPDDFFESTRLAKKISLIRYLSDINFNQQRETYAQVELFFNPIEKILGGVSDNEQQLGLMVIANNKIIYHTGTLDINQKNEKQFLGKIKKIVTASQPETISKFSWIGKDYLAHTTRNPVTDWTIIQYTSTNVIFNTFFSNTVNYLLLTVLLLFGAIIISLWFNRYFSRPIKDLSKKMISINTDNLQTIELKKDRYDEIGILIKSFNEMINRIKQSREAEKISYSLQKKAELKMLQAQINPHFLYNTLNAIYAIAQIYRVPEISNMAKSLSELYRYNVKYGEVVEIRKELEQIKNYINIQQIRFPGKFNVTYQIDPDVLSQKMLKFLIQPIIENSFFHGLEPKIGKGNLILSIQMINQAIVIRVEDDGVGIPQNVMEKLKRMLQESFYSKQLLDPYTNESIGIWNVFLRIKYFYGENSSLEIYSEVNKGTIVEIKIPIKQG